MALSMDSISKLSTRKKILLLIVILGIIAGLFTYLVVLPQNEERDRLKVELDNLTKELNEAKAITRDLPKFQEQAAMLEKQLAEAVTQLPNEKEIPEILKKTEEWMAINKFETVDSFRGKLSKTNLDNPAAIERVQFMKLYSGIE